MGKLVRPTFGKPCFDCGNQVPHARLKIIEGDLAARGLPPIVSHIVCVDCQELRENEIRRETRASMRKSTVVISYR